MLRFDDHGVLVKMTLRQTVLLSVVNIHLSGRLVHDLNPLNLRCLVVERNDGLVGRFEHFLLHLSDILLGVSVSFSFFSHGSRWRLI